MAKFTEIAQFTDEQAREYLERVRWPEGPVCPHCGSCEGAYGLDGKTARDGLYKCAACRREFTVTVNTVMHRSKIPLKKWIMAFHLICASKKSISALQLQRMLDLGSYKTAWHMAHRIRLAMREAPLAGLLKGDVEADETFVGGRPRKPHKGTPKRKKGRHADFKDRKTAVLALVERGGRVRATVRTDVTGENLKDLVRRQVDPSARLITDEYVGYKGLGAEFAGGHHTVTHLAGEYVRGDIHTNTIEGYFSLLKRSIVGAYHNVSRKHLGRYCDEVCFRWNHRTLTDAERTAEAIRSCDGKRLLYRAAVS